MSEPPFSSNLYVGYNGADGTISESGGIVTSWAPSYNRGVGGAATPLTPADSGTDPQISSINGVPAVIFTGASKKLAVASGAGFFSDDSITIFIGAQFDTGINTDFIIPFDANPSNKWRLTGGNITYIYGTAPPMTPGAPVQGEATGFGGAFSRNLTDQVEDPHHELFNGVVTPDVPFGGGDARHFFAGPPRFYSSAANAVVRIGVYLVYDRKLTPEEFATVWDWFAAEYNISSAPYPGLHEVTNIDNASNAQCIYFGQAPAIEIGDKFSFKETSEINGWGVAIDADGFPIITPDNIPGTDSFLFDIDRGEGYNDPSEWTFTIAPPVAGIEYVLLPNVDGTQRTNYPDGDYEPEVPIVLPPPSWAATPITNITQNSMTVSWVYPSSGTDADGFILQRYITGVSTSWTSHPATNPTPAIGARSSVEQGLPHSTLVRFRLAAKSGNVVSEFSEMFDG